MTSPSDQTVTRPTRKNIDIKLSDAQRLRDAKSFRAEKTVLSCLLLISIMLCLSLTVECGKTAGTNSGAPETASGNTQGPLAILGLPLVEADAGMPYTGMLSANGGVTPYQWSIAIGSLPSGIQLQPSSGNIMGMTAVAGSYAFTAKVTDSSGQSTTRGFTLTVLVLSSTVDVIVNVTPKSVTIPSGSRQQFTATVMGTSNTGVTWSDCAGSITQTGLWTAPVVPNASNKGDCIYAISQADSTKIGEAYAFVVPLTNDCLPPTYGCLYTGTEPQLPGTPPFSTATPSNTVVRLSDLSMGKMVRVTDPSFGTACAPWSATHSGGDYDVITNTTGTMLLVTCGGSAEVLGFNPETLQVTNLSQAKTAFKTLNKCAGPPAWSRAKSNVLFCKPQANEITPLGTTTGTQLYSLTFPFAMGNLCGTGIGTCPDPTAAATWALVFDFASCPQASSAPPYSGSILGTGSNDSLFTTAMSWTGGQDTARYQFAYIPNVGCSTLDTQAVGGAQVHLTNGLVEPAINRITGTPLAANWWIHNSTTNGSWIAVAKDNCVGADCGIDTDAPELWIPNTQTVQMVSAVSGTGGHGSMSKSYIQNAGNPTQWLRPIANLNDSQLIFQLPGDPNCCQDGHFNANILNDTDPIIAASGGPLPATNQPAQYYSEIYLMSVDGSMKGWRCCHTYSSGSAAAGFEGEYAIGAPNQPRTVFCFSSDMDGALGTITVDGILSNRTDAFCAGLAGQ